MKNSKDKKIESIECVIDLLGKYDFDASAAKLKSDTQVLLKHLLWETKESPEC